jgi:trans-aconitate 2-methyltransferase
MLEKARSAGFPTEFADIVNWAPPEPVDIIFSNAALQWLPDHSALFPRLLAYLTPGGMLAIQMPAMHNEPVRALRRVVASSGPWETRLSEVTSAPPIFESSAYYDLLSGLAAAVDIWVTEYLLLIFNQVPAIKMAQPV